MPFSRDFFKHKKTSQKKERLFYKIHYKQTYAAGFLKAANFLLNLAN